MTSGRFQTLETRVKDLRRLLLPAKFDPTGTYADAERVSTRAVSFRVLVHAEIEAYLEDRVLEIIKTAKAAWETDRHVSVVTIHLLGFSGVNMDRPPETLTTTEANKMKDWHTKVVIDDRFSVCATDLYRRISKENHGIKEKHILAMFIPVGFDMAKCDDAFLQAMNAFGDDRGLVAHTSGVVRQAVDPRDEYNRVMALTKALELIDTELDRLLAAATPPP